MTARIYPTNAKHRRYTAVVYDSKSLPVVKKDHETSEQAEAWVQLFPSFKSYIFRNLDA